MTYIDIHSARIEKNLTWFESYSACLETHSAHFDSYPTLFVVHPAQLGNNLTQIVNNKNLLAIAFASTFVIYPVLVHGPVTKELKSQPDFALPGNLLSTSKQICFSIYWIYNYQLEKFGKLVQQGTQKHNSPTRSKPEECYKTSTEKFQKTSFWYECYLTWNGLASVIENYSLCS